MVNRNNLINMIQYFERRKQLKECDQVITLFDYQIMSVCSESSDERDSSLCTMKSPTSKQQQKKIVLLFEKIGIQLEQEILNRRNKQPFEEIELWSVLSSCIMGTFSLLQMGLKEPILSPKTISLTKDGIIKVGEWEATSSSQEDSINYNKILSNYYWPP